MEGDPALLRGHTGPGPAEPCREGPAVTLCSVDTAHAQRGLFCSLPSPRGDGPAVGAPAESGLFSCRLRCHRNDPSLDDPIPQEYALFLCPTGPLLEKLEEFWKDSKRQCAKNRAHEVFPHITLCDFFTVSRAREPLVLTDTPPEALPRDVQRRWM